MFTGIVQGAFEVTSLENKANLLKIGIKLPKNLLDSLELGASIAVDGVCLTVSEIESEEVFFNIMKETLAVTTLGNLKVGYLANIERSLKFDHEIGGHILSGHVDSTAEVVDIKTPENNYIITFKVNSESTKYIFSKGYIGINGASLTVVRADKEASTFQVYLIPDTLSLTNLNEKKVSDKVNIEIDRQTQVIVDTVERVLSER